MTSEECAHAHRPRRPEQTAHPLNDFLPIADLPCNTHLHVVDDQCRILRADNLFQRPGNFDSCKVLHRLPLDQFQTVTFGASVDLSVLRGSYRTTDGGGFDGSFSKHS